MNVFPRGSGCAWANNKTDQLVAPLEQALPRHRPLGCIVCGPAHMGPERPSGHRHVHNVNIMAQGSLILRVGSD